jgi:F-type H+-transporting ATPase subunit gamma
MAQLLEIKSRIRSVDSTLKITKAMKMIATARLARARERFNKVKPVYKRIENIAQRMSNIENINEHELFIKRDVEKVLFVILSTNRGFCGGYNIKLFNHLEDHKHRITGKEIYYLPVGMKAVEYYDKYENVIDLPIINDLIWESEMFNQSRILLHDLKKMYLNQDFDEIYLVYNSFKSILLQQPKIKRLLPLEYIDNNNQEETDYIFEPNKEIIIEDLLNTYLILTINTALIELETGEYGARMSAMEGANRNGEKLTKKLKIQYQRARQEAITRQITEIIGGAETLRREKDE